MTQIVRDSVGVYWLEITPDPSVELWYVKTAGGETRTFAPKDGRVRLGKGLTEPVTATLTPADVVRRAPESYTYPAVAPPPGENGAALRAAIPWLDGLLKLPSSGSPRRISDGTRARYDYGWQPIVGGEVDGVKIESTATVDEVLVMRLVVEGLRSAGKVQGFGWHGPGRRMALLGARFRDIDTDPPRKLSHGVYTMKYDAEELWLLSVFCDLVGGHNLMFYPGGGAGGMVNVTSLRSILGPGVNLRRHPIEGAGGGIDRVQVRNAICAFNGRWGIEIREDVQNVHISHSCIWGNTAGDIDALTDGQYTIDRDTCVFADPDLDSRGKPRNPKVVNGADPAWLPPFDCYEQPFVRPTMGAVAG